MKKLIFAILIISALSACTRKIYIIHRFPDTLKVDLYFDDASYYMYDSTGEELDTVIDWHKAMNIRKD